MRKYLIGFIVGFSFIFTGTAIAVNVTVPQSTAYGDILRGNANGTYSTVATSTLGLPTAAYPFVPSTNYGVTQSATSTAVWGRAGIYASTTGATNALSVSSSGNGRAFEVTCGAGGPCFWANQTGTSGYFFTGIMRGESVNPWDIAHNPDNPTSVTSFSWANNITGVNTGPLFQLSNWGSSKGLLLSCWQTGDWCDRVQSQGFGVFISANGDGGASTPFKVASGAATSTILEINSSGNLAIGSFTTIAHKLEVGSTTGQNTTRINGLSTVNNAPALSLFRSGTVEWSLAAGGTAASDFSISANPNSTYTDASLASNAKLTIKSTGNVGIGTSSPYAALSVNGQTVALYYTATSTTQASTLPYASTTALSVSTLTSGNCVQASTGGLLTTVSAACGTGTVTSVTASLPIVSSGGTTPNLTWTGLATTSALVDGRLLYGSGASGVANVATSTLTFSGPFSGTGFGALVGGSNTTVTWTGLATSSAIANNQVLYGTSVSGVAGNSNFVWLNGPGWHGVGTTTPQWLVTLATTTAPQLVLQGGVSDAPWAERSVGGALYFATTTNTATFATSSAANTAFTIDTNGVPRFSALGGVSGCAQFDNTGKLSNVGASCGVGTVTSVTATFPLTSSGGATPALTFVGIGTSSPLGTNQAVYSTGVNTVASVATTTLGFSGPFSGTGNGALLGGANTTVTWTGLATSSALTTNNIMYATNATSGVAPAGKLTWLNGPGWYGNGTSTPQWLETLATTTAPQLVLQGGSGDAPWAMRSIGGALYFATTTNTATFATSSAANTSLTIDTNGFPRFSALGGVAGCAQFDNTGKIANTGTVCGNSVSAFEMATTSLTISQLAYVNQVSGRTTLASVATTTLTFSGPFSGTGFGALVGGTNTTVTYTGLATTTALTANQVLYAANSTTGVSGSNNHVWLNGGGWLGVGTSTPQWLVTLATTTAPQLVLQGAKTDAPWSFRSIGGYLYVATTTNTATFATSTLSALTITAGGEVTASALQMATSTAIILDWKNTPNQVEYRVGSAAFTITMTNATTADMYGATKRIVISNPPTVSAGAMTLVGNVWLGTTPTQTTTAGSGDIYSCVTSMASSTSAFKVECTEGAGLN